VIPNTFNYKGKSLVEELDKELKLLGYEELSDNQASPSPTKKDLKMNA
jgi:hypothetical protein